MKVCFVATICDFQFGNSVETVTKSRKHTYGARDFTYVSGEESFKLLKLILEHSIKANLTLLIGNSTFLEFFKSILATVLRASGTFIQLNK